MSVSTLFRPVQLGRYLLPHRIVMAPMSRNRTLGGVPNAMNALYYSQRASAAMIVTEGASPSVTGYGYLDTPGIHTDEQVRGWRGVTEAVHGRGGRIFAQLMHVGRVSHPDYFGRGAAARPLRNPASRRGADPLGQEAVRNSPRHGTWPDPTGDRRSRRRGSSRG